MKHRCLFCFYSLRWWEDKNTEKNKKKKPTLTLIKDNPQTTQLPIEKNELNHAASD